MNTPGHGTRAAINASLSFILGVLFIALAVWGADNSMATLGVWASVFVGLVFMLPVSWFQLFD